MHLNHENMQHGVPSRDERWDKIRSMIKFDQAFGENQVGDYGLYLTQRGVGVLHNKGTCN
jgi:hypothetical protein